MGANAVYFASFFSLALAVLGMRWQFKRGGFAVDDEQEQIAKLREVIEQQRSHFLELGEILERDYSQMQALTDAHDRLARQLEAYRNLKFPAALRKMWTGAEVAQWLEGEHERIALQY